MEHRRGQRSRQGCSHLPADDLEFGLRARTGNWNINLLTQAPKSLDTKICDLSFFRALQAEQWRSGVEDNIDGLIAQVLAAFERFDPRKNDFGFLTLQCCLDDILREMAATIILFDTWEKRECCGKEYCPTGLRHLTKL